MNIYFYGCDGIQGKQFVFLVTDKFVKLNDLFNNKLFETFWKFDLPAILLEDEIEISGFLLDRDLLLNTHQVKVLHHAVDQVFLSFQPIVKDFLASDF